MGRIVTGHDARFGEGDDLARILGSAPFVPAPEIPLEALLERLRVSQRRRIVGLATGVAALALLVLVLIAQAPTSPPVHREIEVVDLQGPELFRPGLPIDAPAEFARP